MQIDKSTEGFRFWGYEPVSKMKTISSHGKTREQHKADKDDYEADRDGIRACGIEHIKMGYKAKIAAIGAASKIEKATGVTMRVFNHDYL